MADFSSFSIDQVIMHHVPQATKNNKATSLPVYSEAVIDLDPRELTYLNGRMRGTLGGYARPVVEDQPAGSPVPGLVRELLADPSLLVQNSIAITQRLHETQPAISPVGLALVVLGKVGSEAAVLISKVEHEQGMRVDQTQNAEGLRTYKAEYLNDLIFGQKTRVFKSGVFLASALQRRLLRGHVVDEQQGSHGVAEFFVSDCLGCTFTQRADVLTEKLFKATEKWIRKSVPDPELQAEYEIALLAEMQSSKKKLSTALFAQDHIKTEDDRISFLAAVEAAGVPGSPINKDITLISSSIKRIKVDTQRNATVLVPPEMYQDGTFQITHLDDGNSEIVVVDEIKGMSGASGQRRNSEQ